MTAELTMQAIREYCVKTTGSENTWQGKNSSYQWSIGRENSQVINGVVRKLAGIDSSGTQIWVVAGSFKIDQNGKILRFTGLSKKIQEQVFKPTQIQTDLSIKEVEPA